MDYPRPDLLAEPAWLAAHLDDPQVRVIDASLEAAYRRAHIPGAVRLPTHHFLKEAGPPGTDHGVLILAAAEFEALMRAAGVSADTTVVCYDDDNARVASRLWWVLRYFGHDNTKVLNGGWQSWVSEGRPVSVAATQPAPGTFVANTRPEVCATVEYLKAHHADPAGQVLDVRSDAEFAGAESRGNRRVGHIPGARHLEWLRTVDSTGTHRFLPAAEIQGLLDEAGILRGRPVTTYCQGGIRAAHAAFVLGLMGYEHVRVYDGSMGEWANRDDTPLAL